MLVGLRGHWKYPIGYVLIASISANNLHCLLNRALELSTQHNLGVYTITLDGPSYNLAAMCLFGCKLGNEVSLIDGKFNVEVYEHFLCFFLDPPPPPPPPHTHTHTHTHDETFKKCPC